MRNLGNIPGHSLIGETFQSVSISRPSNKPKAPSPPFSLRLTFEERARLEAEAGDMALGAYIRMRLFDDAAPPRRIRAKRPVKDDQALASLLGELGKARIANNLNQLAKAANSGSLHVTPETESSLREACAGIQWLRQTLVQALGLQS